MPCSSSAGVRRIGHVSLSHLLPRCRARVAVVQHIAHKAQIPQFSTHTLRHLRLTDLARCRTDIHAIAAYAGHRSLETTKLYIRLSGGETAERVRVSMERLDERLGILFAEARG